MLGSAGMSNIRLKWDDPDSIYYVAHVGKVTQANVNTLTQQEGQHKSRSNSTGLMQDVISVGKLDTDRQNIINISMIAQGKIVLIQVRLHLARQLRYWQDRTHVSTLAERQNKFKPPMYNMMEIGMHTRTRQRIDNEDTTDRQAVGDIGELGHRQVIEQRQIGWRRQDIDRLESSDRWAGGDIGEIGHRQVSEHIHITSSAPQRNDVTRRRRVRVVSGDDRHDSFSIVLYRELITTTHQQTHVLY